MSYILLAEISFFWSDYPITVTNAEELRLCLCSVGEVSVHKVGDRCFNHLSLIRTRSTDTHLMPNANFTVCVTACHTFTASSGENYKSYSFSCIAVIMGL